jgi:hypothetical protein
VHEPAGAVDVADLQVQRLGHAQAERVDGPEVSAVLRRADGSDELPDLVAGERIEQRLVAGDA